MIGASNILRTIAASIVGVFVGGGQALASPVEFGSNYYDFVLANGISWADANAAASCSVFGGVKP
jgi:hypothetical protein